MADLARDTYRLLAAVRDGTVHRSSGGLDVWDAPGARQKTRVRTAAADSAGLIRLAATGQWRLTDAGHAELEHGVRHG